MGQRPEPAPAIPRHVAIVMDGNGRWAKKRHMPRFFGHKQGVDALVRTVHACAERGIEYLTVFAFSSENWKRPSEEVSGLMGLVLVAVSKYLAKLSADGVRVRIVGDRAQVSDKLRQAWQHAEDSTRHNTKIQLSVAFNYGGRWDIVQACRQAIAAGLDPATLDEATLNRFMYYLFEAVTGRQVSDLWLDRLQRGGVAIMLMMMSLALYNDMARLLGLQ